MKAYYYGVLPFVFLLCSCMIVLEGGVPGRSGGYVFYDKGAYSDGWRYMECAPGDIGGKVDWNTAKNLCDEYALNGYEDWSLPSIKELTLMYNNLHEEGMGHFDGDAYYWSSEERDSSSAYLVDFGKGDTTSWGKDRTSSSSSNACHARPVRKF